MAEPNGRVKAALDYLNANLARFQEQLVTLSRIPERLRGRVPAGGGAALGRGHGGASCARWASRTSRCSRSRACTPTSTATGCTSPARPPSCSTATTTCSRPGRPEKWLSPAFEPTERDGRLFGRGTADDKARRAWPTSPRSPRYLKSRRRAALQREVPDRGRGGDRLREPRRASSRSTSDMLAADFIVLSDTANFDTGIPALTYQLRGIVQVDVEVQVPRAPGAQRHVGRPGARPGAGPAALIADLQRQGRLAQHPRPLQGRGEAAASSS